METKYPPLLLSLLAVFLISMFLALGKWQIDRKQEKAAVVEEHQSRGKQPAVDLLAVDPPYEKWRYRQVRFIGEPLGDQQLLLDNQVQNGLAGYNVLTPFSLLGAPGKIVLVDRGWIEQGTQRGDALDIDVAPGLTEIKGTLYVPLGEPFVLGNIIENENASPLVLQHLDFSVLKELLGNGLLPFSVRLSDTQPGGYLRKWTVVSTSPTKHLGYAVMFFSLSLLVVVLYLALLLRSRAQLLRRR